MTKYGIISLYFNIFTAKDDKGAKFYDYKLG